jgi:hypothetical protein
MTQYTRSLREAWWVIGLVGLHAAVALAHSGAHLALTILPPAVDEIFIVLVIGVAPILALPFVLRGSRVGMGMLALAMAASWLYGAIHHFVLAGEDHVMALNAGAWQATFTITAAALFGLEAGGAFLAAWLCWRASVARLRAATMRP